MGLSNDFLSGIQGGEDALHFFDNQMTIPMVRISEWFRQIATSRQSSLASAVAISGNDDSQNAQTSEGHSTEICVKMGESSYVDETMRRL